MSRMDWKKGRFTTDWETNEIEAAMRGHQNAQVGDTVDYYRIDRDDSVMNSVYDEGSGIGKTYHGPYTVPCIHVTHNEGRNLNTDGGFYFNDDLYVTASFNEVERVGFTLMDLQTQGYLNDRMVYDDKVFRVTDIHVLGQIQRRDIILSMAATQVKPDELVDDLQFSRWSA